MPKGIKGIPVSTASQAAGLQKPPPCRKIKRLQQFPIWKFF
jgi:hypothetical protein